MKTVVVLPDGTKISSGAPGEIAIEGVTLTQNINDNYDLTPGTVSAGSLEMTVLTQEGISPVEEGDLLWVYEETAEGTQMPIGSFYAQKPAVQSANRLRITAYDPVSLLDKDLTDWLAGLTGWPYLLRDFAQMVCAECGITPELRHFINHSFPVERITATGVTGRQLMRWICQAGGAFCRADAYGKVYMGWYANRGVALKPGGSSFYYQGSLSYADYAVSPVTRVCLRQTGEDVGISYPQTADPDNPLVITGNPLLSSENTQALTAVAKNLYEQMRRGAYTPCRVTAPAVLGLQAGDAFTVTDARGVTVTGLVMSRVRKGGRDTVSCTGNPCRTDPAAKNNLTHYALTGKVMNLQTSVDGLKAENKDSAGKVAALELTVSGISTQVSQQSQKSDSLEQEITSLDQYAAGIRAEVSRQDKSMQEMSRSLTAVEQTAQQVQISVQSMEEKGVSRVQTETGYTFGADGLRIQKLGQEMENLLDEKGMTVSRGDTVMLRADKDGVLATDVTVRNYLIVGSHARFEDHSDGRTACFWI